MSKFDLQTTIPALERSLALFRPHHQELRSRLIKVLGALVIFSGVAYAFSDQIAKAFIAPLFAASPLVYKLVYTNLPEAFVSYIKLSIMVGIGTSFPVILYQVWMFVAPGLKKNEKKLALTVVFWSTLLFFFGGCFAFFAVLPRMLAYFMSYANPGLIPLPKLSLYLTFVARTIVAFGLAFQIPFLMVMTGKAGFTPPSYFRKNRLYFYGAIVVLSFLLAAGDFMSSGLLAVPLIGLYESGIFLTALFAGRKQQK